MPAPSKQPPLTIAVDFDGTLCDFAYPGIGKVKDGAKEALSLFRRLGYKVIINSCRTCSWHFEIFGTDPNVPTLDRPEVIDMKEFLDAEGLEYDLIDDGSKGKPLADFYIDDKGIRFRENWAEIASVIEVLTKAPELPELDVTAEDRDVACSMADADEPEERTQGGPWEMLACRERQLRQAHARMAELKDVVERLTKQRNSTKEVDVK